MQLNLRLLLQRGQRYFGGNRIVTRLADGGRHAYTHREFGERLRRLASRLDALGTRPGERIATFAWNSYRHLELYFALPCTGRVVHTVNLRLADEHVAYILRHSQDTAVFVDPDLLPVMERIAHQVPSVRAWVVLAERLPPTTLPNAIAYEDLIAAGDPAFELPDIPENTVAGMCYTSATTGLPKGVEYTHRGIVLHTLAECQADALGIRERDTILQMVPMFHANAWGLPYAAALTGAELVLPGERPQAADLLDLIERERVTFAAAAVSVGIDMIAELKRRPRDLSSVRGIILGGSATPAAVMEYFLDAHGIPIYTAWGATEMAPLATCAHVPRALLDRPAREHIPVRVRQGIPVPGAEVKVLDAQGREVPWDDASVGEVYARAPWSSTEYFRDERSAEGFRDGWWRSGDMATVDAAGVLRLVDRAKDLIKSGGEWISSVDLENALVAHPGVREAAVVAVPDPKWLERPCAYFVPAPDATPPTAGELRAWLEPRFARWWLPDHYLPIEQIPRTGVGKIDKRALRERVAADVAALGAAG